MLKNRYDGGWLTRRQGLQWSAATLGGLALPRAGAAAVLRVGRQQAIKTLAAAAREARDGMLIEVEAGDYPADVAVWTHNDLSLKAVGGRVRMLARGASAQRKAIFVTQGERMRIEGFDFIGASVADRNGAGIRLERGSLRLLDCRFQDNEMGLLSSNDPQARLEIEGCEFGPSARQSGGLSHNLYVGRIARLSVSGSYFHHGYRGHLLKSRAAVNHVFYNRLSDEIGGEASYELEFPDGGLALVVGNVIQQSSSTQNPCLVSFGAEGLLWPRQELHLVNNSLIDQLPNGGVSLHVARGVPRVRLINNVLAGNPFPAGQDGWAQRSNFVVDWDEFVQATRENYALEPQSSLRGKAVDAGEVDGLKLLPTRQYQHPLMAVALKGPARHPGAVQTP